MIYFALFFPPAAIYYVYLVVFHTFFETTLEKLSHFSFSQPKSNITNSFTVYYTQFLAYERCKLYNNVI